MANCISAKLLRDIIYISRYSILQSKNRTFFKNILLLCCSILLLSSSLYSTDLKIIPETEFFEVGDSLIVNVTINDINNLFGAGFYFIYDSDQLKYIASNEGSFINSNDNYQTIFLTKNEPEKNRIITGVSRTDYRNGGAASSSDTVLMTFVFEVLLSDSIPLKIERSSLVAPDGETEFEHNVSDSFIISQIATDINISESLPSSFSLVVGNAYPNPFNPTTMILYEVSRKEELSVDVYNINGQKMVSLFNGTVLPGEHQLEFNISNGDFGSGVYFVMFKTSSESIKKKIILLK